MNARQLKIADDILGRLNQDKVAHLAGGAVRDFFLGRDAVDLDFFINSFGGRGWLERWLTRVLPDFHLDRIVGDEARAEYGNPDLRFVFFGTYKDQPVNIMITRTHNGETVSRFPCNLSKAAYGVMGFERWPEFVEGVEDQVLKFKRGTAERYLLKIMQKFPHYRTEWYD